MHTTLNDLFIFTLKKVPKGNTSKSHFKNRLRIWHELNYIPQFVAPTAIKKVIPPYLNSFSAMSNLPKKSRPTKPVDKLFYAVPTKKRISKFPNEEWRAYDFSSRSWQSKLGGRTWLADAKQKTPVNTNCSWRKFPKRLGPECPNPLRTLQSRA